MTQKASKTQIELAKAANTFILENMEKKVTIKQLSEHFHVSPTHMKNCFRKTYGSSIYAYTRREKMNAASDLLKNTDLTVLEIAGMCGYDNGSKFAKVFKDVTGLSPSSYRREHLMQG